MKRLAAGALVWLLLIAAHMEALGERLEAIWLGPDGNGGAGDWNTATNWNLGVVPDNGSDGNGDGLPDIFDVWIDGLPPATAVHNDSTTIEVAGLNLGEDDKLELATPLALALRDPDGLVEVVNNGSLRVGGWNGIAPMLAFAGDEIRLSGSGAMELGVASARPGAFAALDGGRLVNGPGHTLRTAGVLHGGRIRGYRPDMSNFDLSLTNQGIIVADDGANLSIHLNEETHHNLGTIRATNRGSLSVTSGGTFRNTSRILADQHGKVTLEYAHFVNEALGSVRVASGGMLTVIGQGDSLFENNSVIEVIDGGMITIQGKSIANLGNGGIQARTGGVIHFNEGTFRNDSAIQVLDGESELIIGVNAVFENEGSVLSARSGRLTIGASGLPSLVRGGEVTSGAGELRLNGAMLEDVKLSGTASGTGMSMRGRVSFEPGFTLRLDGSFHLQGNFGPGLSVASDLEGGDHLSVSGNLTLSDVNLVLTGGQVGDYQLIALYSGRRIGTFKHVTPGYEVVYDDENKFIRVTPIPEPGSVALAMVGMIAVGLWRWRKRR